MAFLSFPFLKNLCTGLLHPHRLSHQPCLTPQWPHSVATEVEALSFVLDVLLGFILCLPSLLVQEARSWTLPVGFVFIVLSLCTSASVSNNFFLYEIHSISPVILLIPVSTFSGSALSFFLSFFFLNENRQATRSVLVWMPHAHSGTPYFCRLILWLNKLIVDIPIAMQHIVHTLQQLRVNCC